MKWLWAILCRLGFHPWQEFTIDESPDWPRRVCLECHRRQWLSWFHAEWEDVSA